MSEVIFEVHEDAADGGFTASALGFGIHTEADTMEALRANVREPWIATSTKRRMRPKSSTCILSATRFWRAELRRR